MSDIVRQIINGKSTPLKITVVGDLGVGKTCLLISYTSGDFPTETAPTVFDNFIATHKVDDKVYNITLCDNPGQEEYGRLRPISYPQKNVFIVCFALNLPSSFVNVSEKWLPELRYHCPRSPIVLVGTKKDESNNDVLTSEDGKELCRKAGLYKYVECSAKTKENIQEVFTQAVLAAVAPAVVPAVTPPKKCTLI